MDNSKPQLASEMTDFEVKRWRILNREYKQLSSGQQFSRKLSPATSEPVTDWKEIEETPLSVHSPSPPGPERKKLHLVREDQAEGEPRHWSLFVTSGEDKSSKGTVWQVTGDAMCTHYNNLRDVAQFASDAFNSNYELNSSLTDVQERLVEDAVNNEMPPSAEDERSITENCQGWTIRVLRRLQDRGVVAEGTAEWIERDLKDHLRRR